MAIKIAYRTTLLLMVFLGTLDLHAQLPIKNISIGDYLAKHFDSAIILHNRSNDYASPIFRVLAIKDDSLYSFIHRAKKYVLFGEEIRDSVYGGLRSFKDYFINIQAYSRQENDAWQRLNDLQLWSLPASLQKPGCDAFDLSTDEFRLISKNLRVYKEYYALYELPSCGADDPIRTIAKAAIEIIAKFFQLKQ